MSDLNSRTQTDLDAILERITPEKREDFLRARLRLKQFHENEEVLALANYMDNFAALIDGLTKNIGPSTNANQQVAVQGSNHDDLGELTLAFERLTAAVQAQQSALAKLDQNDDKILRKVTLHVEGQTRYQLANWFWWTAGSLALLILAALFFLGVWYGEKQTIDAANARMNAAYNLAEDRYIALVHSITRSGPSPTPNPAYVVKPLPTH